MRFTSDFLLIFLDGSIELYPKCMPILKVIRQRVELHHNEIRQEIRRLEKAAKEENDYVTEQCYKAVASKLWEVMG